MSFNSDLMFDALNQTEITDLLDTVDSVKGLFSSRAIPTFFIKFKTVNFYLVSPISGALEWGQYIYSVNCRAKTDGESRAIAEAVFDNLNRSDFTEYHTNCDVLVTIQPADDTDVYNTPLEILLKTRN